MGGGGMGGGGMGGGGMGGGGMGGGGMGGGGMGTIPWPAPEVAENINTKDMGNLGLTPQEGMALVAFLTTLTDQ
jgi:hypothetical protein